MMTFGNRGVVYLVVDGQYYRVGAIAIAVSLALRLNGMRAMIMWELRCLV